jgi:hypothetical protein
MHSFTVKSPFLRREMVRILQGYIKARGRRAGTVRRGLGVLRAEIDHAHRAGRLTRAIAVDLPNSPEACVRRLTRGAAALLHSALREPPVRLHLPPFILLGLYSGFHHEHFGLERFEHPREFEVEEVPGVLQVSRTYLAESLAGRASEHQIDFSIDELPLGGHAWMLVDEEAGHVSSKHGYLREIDPVGTPWLRR